jgi:hypothetical protein
LSRSSRLAWSAVSRWPAGVLTGEITETEVGDVQVNVALGFYRPST